MWLFHPIFHCHVWPFAAMHILVTRFLSCLPHTHRTHTPSATDYPEIYSLLWITFFLRKRRKCVCVCDVHVFLFIFMKIAVWNWKYVLVRIIWFRFYGLTFTMWLYNFLCTQRFIPYCLLINFTFIATVTCNIDSVVMQNMKIIMGRKQIELSNKHGNTRSGERGRERLRGLAVLTISVEFCTFIIVFFLFDMILVTVDCCSFGSLNALYWSNGIKNCIRFRIIHLNNSKYRKSFWNFRLFYFLWNLLRKDFDILLRF